MVRLTAAVFCAAATLLAADDDLDSQMKSVIGAYAIVQQNAADPVTSEQAFYQGAIPGLLRRLDPHSVFFDPGQFEQLKRMESSTQKGFGSVVSLLPGRVDCAPTLPGTPSAKAGLARATRLSPSTDTPSTGSISISSPNSSRSRASSRRSLK